MVDTVEQVRPGEIISSGLMNRVLGKLLELENRISSLGSGQPGSTAPAIATGLVEKSAFTIGNVPGANPKGSDQPRATSFIAHGLGPVAVAVIIGLEDLGKNPGAPNFERTVDRYYAFRDTGISNSAFQVAAEVTKPYDGTLKIFTNLGAMEFFDRIRWWTIKL